MRWWLSLDSLRCVDALKYKDEPFIRVNAIQRWRGHDVKTGQTRVVNWNGHYGEPGDFDNGVEVHVELWLDDKPDVLIPHAANHFVSNTAQFVVTYQTLLHLKRHYGDDLFDYGSTERFSVGSGRHDAKYDLSWRMGTEL